MQTQSTLERPNEIQYTTVLRLSFSDRLKMLFKSQIEATHILRVKGQMPQHSFTGDIK